MVAHSGFSFAIAPRRFAAPFETAPAYTEVAMAVEVEGAIADLVSPRVNAPDNFVFSKLSMGDTMSLPEARASRTGKLNEIEFSSDDENADATDYGLLCLVPDRDVLEAKAQELPYDPIENASSALGELMKLLREKRVADLVSDTSSYADGQSVTLAGDSQWSHAASSPVKAIMEALEKCPVRPNTLVFGQEAWTGFRTHGDILNAVAPVGGGSAGSGASAQAVAELLDLERVLVGRAQYQTANRGQGESYSYVWGKHAALLRVNRDLASMQTTVPTFTFTGQAQPIMIHILAAPERGVGNGSHVVKISESCEEVVAWDTAGYLFRNAVA